MVLLPTRRSSFFPIKAKPDTIRKSLLCAVHEKGWRGFGSKVIDRIRIPETGTVVDVSARKRKNSYSGKEFLIEISWGSPKLALGPLSIVLSNTLGRSLYKDKVSGVSWWNDQYLLAPETTIGYHEPRVVRDVLACLKATELGMPYLISYEGTRKSWDKNILNTYGSMSLEQEQNELRFEGLEREGFYQFFSERRQGQHN